MTLKDALNGYGIKQPNRQGITPEMQRNREIEGKERAKQSEKAMLDSFYNEAFKEYMRGI